MNRRFTDQFQLRLPHGMRDQLRIAADQNNRSMNAEIVARLEEHDERGGNNKLREYIEEGRKKELQELRKENEALKARLTRLYVEGGSDYGEFSPSQLSTIKSIASSATYEALRAVLTLGSDIAGVDGELLKILDTVAARSLPEINVVEKGAIIREPEDDE